MLAVYLQCNDNLLKVMEWQVNVLGFYQSCTINACLLHSFRSCQVHEVQFGFLHHIFANLPVSRTMWLTQKETTRQWKCWDPSCICCNICLVIGIDNFPVQWTDLNPNQSVTFLASTCIVKMQCDRLDAMFVGVSLIVRFVSPRNSWIQRIVKNCGCIV